MDNDNQALIDCNLKQGRRIQELEDCIEHIYFNTFPKEKDNFFFWSLGQSIRAVLKENRKIYIEESCT